MDATCTIQDSIHVFSLVHKYVSRILGTYQRLDSEKNYINIPANFRVANSKEYLLQELWQKDREYYFLTNRQEH